MTQTWTFRIEKSFDWAVGFVTEDGFFSVVSDYGNYGYCWSHPGMHILQFLGKNKDTDYILSKISPVQELDHDATILEIRREILQLRRSKNIDFDVARDLWDGIKLVDTDNMLLEEFDREYNTWFGDYRIPRIMRYDIQAQQFMKIIWPQLQKLFLQEFRLLSV